MNSRLVRVRAVVLVTLCLVPVTSWGDQGRGGLDVSLGPSHYVIKVTPTLAYVDAGADVVVAGQDLVVVREAEGLYVPVAHVRVLRVADSFCIAEILDVAAGESVEVLQRAVPVETWERVADQLEARRRPTAGRDEAGPGGGLAVTLLAGLDAGKDVDLLYVGNRLAAVDDVSGAALGLRLSQEVGSRWRIAVTGRLAGEALGGDADVTQLSLEFDAHLLLHGPGRSGPYLGAGVGLHRLTWDGPAGAPDATTKSGFQGVVGLDSRLGRTWGLAVEAGYEKVLAWDDLVDASSARLYGGLSRRF